ncbi:MAG: cyclic nucleotide-binding domain-containing protein [Desulfobacterales bacterium]|nr:cyclic nucleotide-binding domain-containing protein [Desulfobacterales bacterium]
MKNILTHFYLLPDSRFKITWTYINFIGIFILAIHIPINFCIHASPNIYLFSFDILITIIFLLDILFNFRTAFFKDGELIIDISVIRIHYLSSWLIVDVFAAFPFDVIAFSLGDENAGLMLSLLRLLKLVKVISLFSKINVVITYSEYVRFILFIFWILVSINLFSCGWMLIYPNNEHTDHTTFYIKSVYWVVTTLTTVGYGDITPSTNIGRIYTMLVMLLGVGMYGFIIGNISSLIVNVNVNKNIRKERIAALVSFMRQYNIPSKLQENIFSFYDHYLKQNITSYYDRILSDLPPELENELRSHVKIYLISQVPLFKHFSKENLKEIASCFISELFPPSTVIIQEGDIGHEMYFIVYGVVDIISSENTILNRLRPGSCFGEIALLKECKRTATAVATTYCQVYKLEKKDFLYILQKHPDLKEKLEK